MHVVSYSNIFHRKGKFEIVRDRKSLFSVSFYTKNLNTPTGRSRISSHDHTTQNSLGDARVSRFGHGRRAFFPARPYVAIGNGGGGKGHTCVTWTNDDVVPARRIDQSRQLE